jgi:hypothetical protein
MRRIAMRRVLLALGRAKTQLVVALAFSVAAALSPPQAAAQDECPGVVYGRPNTEDYYLVNKATRMLAEVFAHNTAEKAPVVLWRRYGSNNSERFRIARYPLSYGNPCEEQWFTIQAVHSGKYLATDGSKSGAKVVQSTHVSDWARQWRVKLVRLTAEECPSGRCFAAFRHVLENYYDRGRRCLDAANGKFPRPPAEGSALQAFDCIPKFSSPNAVNQEWEVVRAVIWDSSR